MNKPATARDDRGNAQRAWCVALLLLALVFGPPTFGEPIVVAPDVTLEMAWSEPWGAVFAGREQTFHLALEATQDFAGTVAWELQVQGRVLQRKETGVNLKSKQRTSVEIAFAAPPVKDALGIQALLVVTVRPPRESPAQARIEKTLWLFSPEFFSLNRETLSKRGISVFDPEHTVTKLLDSAELTYREVASAEQVAAVTSGVLLVGAGMNLADYRDVGTQLATAAQNGAAVIRLTPTGGTLPLPGGAGTETPRPQSMEFRGPDILRDLDKRLDQTDWAPDHPLLAAGLRVIVDRDRPMIEIGKPEKDAWPWFLARYASGGCLLIAGFPVVETWELSPNPRLALLKILELTAPRGRELKVEENR